jgi:hypothetical protein
VLTIIENVLNCRRPSKICNNHVAPVIVNKRANIEKSFLLDLFLRTFGDLVITNKVLINKNKLIMHSRPTGMRKNTINCRLSSIKHFTFP